MSIRHTLTLQRKKTPAATAGRIEPRQSYKRSLFAKSGMMYGVSRNIRRLKTGDRPHGRPDRRRLGRANNGLTDKTRMTVVVCLTADTASVMFCHKISCEKTKRSVMPGEPSPAPDVLWLEILQTFRFYREGEACAIKGAIPYKREYGCKRKRRHTAPMRGFAIPHGNTVCGAVSLSEPVTGHTALLKAVPNRPVFHP